MSISQPPADLKPLEALLSAGIEKIEKETRRATAASLTAGMIAASGRTWGADEMITLWRNVHFKIYGDHAIVPSEG